MTQQYIGVGAEPNDGQGNPIRTAFIKTNDNFSELYARAQVDPPASLVGNPGDQAGWYAYSPEYFYYCFANYDGTSVIWAQITQIGDIALSHIQNGNSNVSISDPNSNVTIGVSSVGNIAVFSAGGASISGYLTATGNITGGNILTVGSTSATGNITGNYIIGNGSQLTSLPIVYGNANVAVYLPTYTGTLAPSGIYTDGYYWANSIPVNFGGGGGGTYGNANVAVYLPTYTGNIDATLTNGYQPYVTTLGNLQGLVVDGLSGVAITPVGANVVIAPNFNGQVRITSDGVGSLDNMVIGAGTPQPGSFTNISATGTVTGAYFVGDGSQLTNLPNSGGNGTNYTNANVAAYLPTYTGTVAAGNVSVTGRVTAATINGLVNNVNTAYGEWDFGYIVANTYTNPLQYIFAQTSLGNIDMGSITAPASLNIDIGTIF